jgi:hypothetical protein
VGGISLMGLSIFEIISISQNSKIFNAISNNDPTLGNIFLIGIFFLFLIGIIILFFPFLFYKKEIKKYL